MIASGRVVEGRLLLAAMPRLAGLLADTAGEATFTLEFGRDPLQVPYADLQVEAGLTLVCQRSLRQFVLPVRVGQRYGLVRSEDEEAGLPPEHEALLVPEDGLLRPAELVEDELILAVPLVPTEPGSGPVERDWPVPADEEARANPFSALADLKKN